MSSQIMALSTENEQKSDLLKGERTPSSDYDSSELDVCDEQEESADSRTETPADTAFARTKREEEAVLTCIQQASALNSPSVDLSGKRLLAIPDELLIMGNLEYLYLEGNEISFLPDDFFKRFPHLKWLDLRNNCLTRLPCVYLSSHTSLRNLLLQNNQLKCLPLELGLVKTLHGLNIINNPLEFPPAEILSQGTYEIQKFLREMLQAKSNANMKEDLALDCKFEDSGDSSGSDDWNTSASMMDLARQRQKMAKTKSANTSSLSPTCKNLPNGLAQPQHGLAQPQHVSYSQIKHLQMEKLKKSSATTTHSNTADRQRKPSSVQSWKVNSYPEPPSHEYISFKMAEERQVARIREMNDKADAILQRRKNEQLLKDWRDNAKKIQSKKSMETITKGTKEYPETAAEAPFGVDKDFMKMMDNEDRFKEQKEKPKRALSPASRMRIEEQKVAQIQELEQRIKSHTAQMAERRRKPKGTPQEEMEAARRDLEIAEELHRQLMNQHLNVDVRLKQFEADVLKNLPLRAQLKH
ncbi:leucine-rich repeat-containing protein 27-like isoform X2 [Pomacea canaliculata]|uniref:leucine-rich repeat-containing protein 27-like isoform X2 n=1 Tax=Pomacea canaliculata TaxID=400727 RepID=UPI000D730832|nr:leucine-rich repeat-containing protein 27-like isoform X2 [Pomacea canaliculata]